jgi:hypothetical protein
MAANRTKMATLLLGSWIGEAVVVEFLRSVPADQRDAIAARILKSVQAAVKDYADQKLESSKSADIIGHRMMADEMVREAEPTFNRLLELAKTEGG